MSHSPDSRFRDALASLKNAFSVMSRMLNHDDSHRWDMLPLRDDELQAAKDLYRLCVEFEWRVNRYSSHDIDFLDMMSTNDLCAEASDVIDNRHQFFIDKANAENEELDRIYQASRSGVPVDLIRWFSEKKNAKEQ